MSKKTSHWKAYFTVSLLLLAAVLAVASITKLWVLTAIPVGFLFGFFVQKGDLCGASAWSEVLLMKSWRKAWGFWIWIVTGMVGLAVIDLLGLAVLKPKPFIWVNYLAGGVVFGAGAVLAGGCVSGSLFKAGVGHLNSIVALFAIALGVSMVEYSPLSAIKNYCMRTFLVTAADGGSVTLSSLIGLPFWIPALIIAALTIVAAIVFRRRAPQQGAGQPAATQAREPWSKIFTKRNWKPWQAGLALGLVTAVGLLSSSSAGRNYPPGVTHGPMHLQLLITDSNLKHVWKKQSQPPKPAPAAAVAATSSERANASGGAAAPKQKKVVWWLVIQILSIIAGAWVAAKMSGEARLYPKPPQQMVVAILGGFMVGAGAAFAGGCFIGNVTSGWALMSVGNVIFGITAILAIWVTTYFYIMGGSIFQPRE